MRNRFYLFWLTLLVAVSVQAQIQTLTVTGTVTNLLSGAPVVNQEMVIQTDSTGSGLPYYNVVATNPNGAYTDMITFTPGTTSQGILMVSTVDCNGSVQMQQFPYGPNNMTFTADFSICGDTIPVGCQSSFYYYPDSNSTAIQFIDASYGDPVSWLWSFGDGLLSTEQNPTHVYAQAGNYMVELTISTSAGCTSTSSQLVMVGQPSGCQSSFYYYPDSLNTGIQFVDVSFGNPVTWQWLFGDGAVSALQNPVHVYGQPGEYVATLTITTADNCSSTSTQIVYVGQPVGCQAFFMWVPSDTLNGMVPNAIQFTDLSSGQPTQWFWDFGDGTTSYEQNPEHTYNQPGEFVVCLTISSPDSSCNDMMCQPVWVGFPGGDCQAAFYYFPGDTTTVIVPNVIQFVDQSVGEPVSWFWDFGDGTTSVAQNPNHTFPGEGHYLVCLTIQGADSNCTSTHCEPVWVGNPGPGCQASFVYYSADTLVQSNSIQFVDQSLGAPTEWWWDFGDGSVSSEQNPIHQYAQPGMYNTCLIVSNPATQCYDTVCNEVWVNVIIIGCENYFTAQNNGLTVTFDGYMLNGDTASYTWIFGDGSVATGNTVTHTYSAMGSYSVLLTTLNAEGCSYTSSQVIQVADSIYLQTIQGHVMAGTMYPDQGIVLLLPLNTIWNYGAQVSLIDSMGSYQFAGVGPGSYHVLAIPYSVSGDTMAFLPTYYGDVIFWEQASVVTLGTAAATYDIQLVSCNGILPGLGLINGSITANGLKAGMSGVNILLLDEQNQPLVFDRSDASGVFDFSSLAFGTYTIWAELHGVNTVPVTFTLSDENPTATINLKLSGNSVTGIGDAGNLVRSVSQVYPNPVYENARIDVVTVSPVMLDVALFNTMGQLVSRHSLQINGTQQIELLTGALPAGIYHVLITGDDGSVLQRKLVKTNR